MLEIGTLAQHKMVSLLVRVTGQDPDDKNKVMVKPITGEKEFSCKVSNLQELR